MIVGRSSAKKRIGYAGTVTIVVGLERSYLHNQNGMTLEDMQAIKAVANKLGEVIIFRSTGPWAKRWIKRGYPTKNFHVKGKSSDWGPHAGLVPYDGTWSKVGYDAAKAKKGTEANDKGLESGFAGKQVLVLSSAQIQEQLEVAEGNPARTAIVRKVAIPSSQDLLLLGERSGDQAKVAFRACKKAGADEYEIRVYPLGAAFAANPHVVLDRDPGGETTKPLEVMTSNEVGGVAPMTGDYDLFAVCPSMADYGSQLPYDVVKPGIQLVGRPLQPGLAFRAGVGMDNVLDPRLHTMGNADWHDAKKRKEIYRERIRQGMTGQLSADSLRVIFESDEYTEHEDMGNLTPRILRCINEINKATGATGERAALRRVHHNAESHRFRDFGALTAKDMRTFKDGERYGDGFPLWVFQPSSLQADGKPTTTYRDVSTLETLDEFNAYAAALKEAGFFVPKNWIWKEKS